jgi:NAD(P)-dependent dehydrogenase (short-subunit alcohol dehydrogenase family)
VKDLRDRTAVITGGASGIGRAMAGRFAAEGMKIVLADVEAEALDRAVEELRGRGAAAVGVRADVSRAGDVEAIAAEAERAFGPVHVLCNNAGVAAGGPLWKLSEADWAWVLGVNLWGVVHGIRAFVPRMIEHGGEGHVVNTASVAGLAAGPWFGPYCASKHAVVAISETLHHELALTGSAIKVSVLCPGFVKTRIAESHRNRPADLQRDPAEPPVGARRPPGSAGWWTPASPPSASRGPSSTRSARSASTSSHTRR